MTTYWEVEVTDTFGGEANYAWVRRYPLLMPPDAKQTTLVRAAKQVAGWTTLRTRTTPMGDDYIVDPTGRNAPCIRMFIVFKEE